ncbi:hypothetical protein QTP86_010510 [Hemibagrus guttatus]|nr:hypothetical protein QTP86_010510 [Hemibagrus guttatus]
MGEGQKIAPVLISIIFLCQLCWTQDEGDFQYHYTSNYGLLCYDTCHQNGKSYYWCNTKKGWDYCSVKQNTDYKGKECKIEHPCDLYGKYYYWCYNKAGKWGYCGNVQPRKVNNKDLYKSSTFQMECKDKCSYDNSTLHYGCNTNKGWDYCSPSPDVTYKNELCRFDHSCKSHGYKYTWCWTDSGWGYCGIIEKSEICDSVAVPKRESDTYEICLRDNFNGKITKLKQEYDPKAIAEGRKWSNEISQIISNWNNEYLDNHSKSNVITTTNLHLDLQGHKQRWSSTLESRTDIERKRISTLASAAKFECRAEQEKACLTPVDQSGAPLNFNFRQKTSAESLAPPALQGKCATLVEDAGRGCRDDPRCQSGAHPEAPVGDKHPPAGGSRGGSEPDTGHQGAAGAP